jgi:tetratricopeptide (TPR) repeat protein
VAAYLSLAQIYAQTNEFKKAIDVYEKVLEKQPNLWVAANDLAFLLSEHSTSKKDLEKALKLAGQAQKLRPEDPAVMDTMGWVYYKQGDSNRAADLIAKALSKNPDNPVIMYHLGMAYYKLGRMNEAKEQLKKATEAKEDFFGKDEARKTLGKM